MPRPSRAASRVAQQLLSRRFSTESCCSALCSALSRPWRERSRPIPGHISRLTPTKVAWERNRARRSVSALTAVNVIDDARITASRSRLTVCVHGCVTRALTVKRISTTDRTHARTGPDTQRAQVHNHTQNSNSRTHPRQTSRSQLHTHHLPPAPHLPLLISLAAVIGAALPSGRKQGNLTSLAAPRLLACCQWSCKRPPSAAPGDALA